MVGDPANRFEAGRLRERYRLDLDEVDRALLALKVAHPSLTGRKLATLVELSHSAVKLRLRRPAFQRALAETQWDALESARQYQKEAIDRLRELVHSADERVAVRASLGLAWPILRGDAAAVPAGQDFRDFIQETWREHEAETAKRGRDC